MQIKIKNFNGVLPNYLTLNKVYTVYDLYAGQGRICSDDNRFLKVSLEKSIVLNGGSWEIIQNEPTPKTITLSKELDNFNYKIFNTVKFSSWNTLFIEDYEIKIVNYCSQDLNGYYANCDFRVQRGECFTSERIDKRFDNLFSAITWIYDRLNEK